MSMSRGSEPSECRIRRYHYEKQVLRTCATEADVLLHTVVVVAATMQRDLQQLWHCPELQQSTLGSADRCVREIFSICSEKRPITHENESFRIPN